MGVVGTPERHDIESTKIESIITKYFFDSTLEVDWDAKHQFKQTNFSKEALMNYMLSRTCNKNTLIHNLSNKMGSY